MSWSKKKVDSQVLTPLAWEIMQAVDADELSIMRSPVPSQLTNGQMWVDWNSALSEKDIFSIALFYPEKSGSPDTLAITEVEKSQNCGRFILQIWGKADDW